VGSTAPGSYPVTGFDISGTEFSRYEITVLVCNNCRTSLILNFRLVLNVVCLLLGCSPVSVV
jgi:hypothetical protein